MRYNVHRSMADADGPRGPLEALRNAARGGQERFLVALGDGGERPRVAAALTSEGLVVEADSLSGALARLADESFDLAILDLPGADLEAGVEDSYPGRDPLAASRELRPFTDLVLISDGDPVRCGRAFGREVAAVLPRPLPAVDALLRAHIKRLAGFRRARTRGVLVLNAFAGVKAELAANMMIATTSSLILRKFIVVSYSCNVTGVKLILALVGLLNVRGTVIDAPASKPLDVA